MLSPRQRLIRQRHEARFGELRALVHSAPGQRGWSAILDHVSTWPDTTLRAAEVLPYLERNLDHWPAVFREPHSSWLDGRLRDDDRPLLGLCRALRVADYPEHLAPVLDLLAQMPRVEELTVDRELTREELQQLLGAPAMDNLRSLRLITLKNLRYDLLPWMSQQTWWPSVETLEIFKLPGSSRADWLACPVGDAMQRLTIVGHRVGPHHLGLLAREPNGALDALRIEATSKPRRQYRARAQRPLGAWLPQLRRLELIGVGLTDALLTALRGAGDLHNLEHLCLDDNPAISRRSLCDVLAHAPSLQRVSLAATSIHEAVLDALAGTDGEPPLHTLCLRDTGLSRGAIATMAHTLTLRDLKDLDLGYNELTLSDVEGLVDMELPSLRRLDLAGSALDAKALEVLAAAPWFTTLSTLILGGSTLDDAAARHILDDERFHGLKTLRLIETSISERLGSELCDVTSPLRRSARRALEKDMPTYQSSWE